MGGSNDSLLAKLKNLDGFPKLERDFYDTTAAGGIITVVSAVLMALLFTSELRSYLTIQTSNELMVDTSRGEKLQIYINMTMPAMPCDWLSLDVMDVSGDVQLEVDHDVFKTRLDSHGQMIAPREKHTVGPERANSDSTPDCGSCFGAGEEGECCNTCEEVRKAYRRKGWALTSPDTVEQCKREGYSEKLLEVEGEGCHVAGMVEVNKVAGNFHLAPGRSFQQGGQHVHDISPFKERNFDLSHTIHSLSFGKPYPGMKNPLDGVSVQQRGYENPLGTHGMHQYFLKVVPTTFTDSRNRSIATNQYSVTEHFKVVEQMTSTNLPGLFFFFDLSPIKVTKRQVRTPFIEFITSACAIVGGVFTVSGIVDAVIYHGQKAVKKKLDLGKFS